MTDPDPETNMPNPPVQEAMNPWQELKSAGPAGFLALIAMSFPLLGSILLFWLMGTTELGPWLRSHGTTGAAAFAGAFALLASLALLPTYAQCALAGWAFGFSTGLWASMAGIVLGASLGYALNRLVSGDTVEALIRRHPVALSIRNSLFGPSENPRSFWSMTGLITLLRLPPNSPFALANMVMASLRVPFLAYLMGTFAGMLPRSAIAVMIGAAIKQAFSRDSLAAAAPSWVRWLALGVGIAVVLIVTTLINQAIEKFQRSHQQSANENLETKIPAVD